MMRDWTRRVEVGKMSLDVSKYILTIVVVGGAFFGKLSWVTIGGGVLVAAAVTAIGFLVIPPEEEKK